MRTETDVEQFRVAMEEKHGDGNPRADYQVACFEACVPKSFWTVASKQVTYNRDVFDEVVCQYRRRMKRALRGGYSLLFVGDNGVGKAQSVDAPVLTLNGWIPIGSLRPGDRVIGSNGCETTVTGVYPQGLRELYSVCFSDGAVAESTLDHLWAFDRVYSNGGRLSTRREVASLKDWIDVPLRRGGGFRMYAPMVAPIRFRKRKQEIDPYTLGVLLGDGTFGGSSPVLTIGNQDLDILDRIILPDGLTIKSKRKAGCVSASLTGYVGRSSNPLIHALSSLGLWGLHSSEKFVPEAYMFGSIDQRKDVLRGLMDTDGSVSKSQARFSTTSPRLARSVAELAKSLGGTAKIKATSRGDIDVLVKLPGDIAPFACRRKLDAWLRYRNGVSRKRMLEPSRGVVSIEPSGSGEAVCISVDAPDKLYVTSDFVLTHNTMFISYLLTQAIKNGFTAYYTTLAQLDIDIKRGFRDRDADNRLRFMLESDFVAIDEVGKESFKADSFLATRLEHLLKQRYDDEEPVLLGSNVAHDDLIKMYGSTIESMIDGKYQVVGLEPGDCRRAQKKKMKRDMGYGD